jgi:DNA polymerase-4
VARTVVLKLKTADFHTLTRSLTPSARPGSAAELARIACALCDRVARPADHRYRLVGVGLAGFVDADSFAAQRDLFGARSFD